MAALLAHLAAFIIAVADASVLVRGAQVATWRSAVRPATGLIMVTIWTMLAFTLGLDVLF